MKNAILYARVSTDEQAKRGFSLRDQEDKLKRFCEYNDYNVVAIYREDYSAKTFNRPEFQQLWEYAKKNKKAIDLVLFTKWDRFSRNTGESYKVIDNFENIGIKVNAIEQPLELNIPEQKLMLALYLSMPGVDNDRRSLNVKDGLRRALKEERYVGATPKGFDMGRDHLKKPILTPNNDAPLIKKAFEMMATGLHNQRDTLQYLSDNGL